MHSYDIRRGLCPVSLFTVTENASTLRCIEMYIRPVITIGTNNVKIDPPSENKIFENVVYRTIVDRMPNSMPGGRTDDGVELMSGVGRDHEDVFTNTLFNFLRLPNFVRPAAIVKVKLQKVGGIEVRPVSPFSRAKILQDIDRAKTANNTEVIPGLIQRLKKMPVKTDKELFPFVVSLYPSNKKDTDYRLFLVNVGWDNVRQKWKSKTSFEVTTSSGKNLVISVHYDIDKNGLVSTDINVTNRFGV